MKTRWDTRARGRYIPGRMLAAALLAVAAVGFGAEPGGGALVVGLAPEAAPADAAAAEAAQRSLLAGLGLSGKIALIEFGLAGCGKSGEGLDRMIELNRGGTIAGLAFVRVEESGDLAAAEEYFAGKSAGFPVVHDPGHTLARAFEATVYPAFALVDRFGRVRYRGRWPGEDLVGWAGALSGETADPGPEAPLFGVVTLDIPRLLDETRLPDLTGETKPLGDYRGKGGMLAVFVNTWCPFCAVALTALPPVSEVLSRQGVACVVVNTGEAADAVRAFYAGKTGLPPVIFDAGEETAEAWDLHAVPTLFFIGADGTLSFRGPADWVKLSPAVEKALNLPAGSVVFTAESTQYG